MPLWLVIGGNSSGKSAWAEDFMVKTLGYRDVDYIATLDESYHALNDATLQEKIKEHQMRRPSQWTVWNEPVNPINRILALPTDHGVLWDGVGPYIVRNMLDDPRHTPVNKRHASADDALWSSTNSLHTIMKDWEDLLVKIHCRSADTVIVSEETGLGILDINSFTQDFVRALGKFNQVASSCAKGVIMVVAGLPMWLKGACP
ncbi:bifunctional adenosylcobinamide kinase/adenosylcobinamide-phosphate guanylyltransferase [Sulfobacillus thermosulfidooxidans]|uniref:bifunctional adenosylcobinamide kinase/adenosylcobinamide-phosphate guanylyltransferase n=1 Tax=Sulfobacillus thermosulfidooxidans TaxID=28034 RepID=UPI0003F73498|nr:bifunctional adenosylcobinamide kinase/adenosylcobinamide-phosphate guanylyltransferase [Sulfobacillus thermosulfidooxidans]